jgi:hypothetical protein
MREPPLLIFYGVVLGVALGGSIAAGLELTFPKAQSGSMDELSPLLRFWQWTVHDPVAFYTSAVALFTAVLVISTILLWRATKRTAEIAERALSEHERPWLFLQGAKISRREFPGQALTPNNFFICLRWKNVGRAPAVILECAVKFEDIKKLDAKPDYSGAIHLLTSGTVSVGEEFETNEIGPAPTAANVDVQYVMFGRLTYTELNGRQHRTGFALHISPHIAAFSRYGKDAYDYYD